MRALTDVECVCRLHLSRLRAEAGPFLLAALVFPLGMYLFANAVGGADALGRNSIRILAGSIVCSLSLTAISWFGYLLLENRFTGRLKLFATLPLAPSSYVFGVLIFALAQGTLGVVLLLGAAQMLGARPSLNPGLLFGVAMVTMLCLCGLSVIIAAQARSFSEGSLLTDSLGAGLVFLAPVFYPPDTVPRLVRVFTEWLPTACAARVLDASLTGARVASSDLLALAAMACGALALGFRVMRWRES